MTGTRMGWEAGGAREVGRGGGKGGHAGEGGGEEMGRLSRQVTRCMLVHYRTQFCSVQFSSVQDGIYALGKARMRSAPPLRSFCCCCCCFSPNVAFETGSRLHRSGAWLESPR